jgi:predicted MFS family arabinose efflux permease
VSIRRVLASRSRFGAFWATFSLSVLGDAITRTALIWYVLTQTCSPVALGWLSFWLTAPVIAGGLLAGWLLDRFDRRKVMALDSTIKAGIVASLPLIASMHVLPIWYVYVAAAALGFLMMIPLAGVPSLLVSMVEEEERNAANSLESIGFTFGGVAGPPIAGALVVFVGPLDALYLDAASYLAFAVATMRCRVRRETPAEPAEARVGLVAAAKVVFESPVLLNTTAMYLVFNIGTGALLVVIPVLTGSVLGAGPEAYGVLLACLAVGELAGSVAAGNLRLPVPEGLAICFAALLSGVGVAVAAVGGGMLSVGVGIALYGAFSAPLTIWGQTLRMKIIPPGYHGRCFAIMRTLMQSGDPAGGLSAGFLMPVCGPRIVLASVALLTVLIGAVGLSIPRLRTAR